MRLVAFRKNLTQSVDECSSMECCASKSSLNLKDFWLEVMIAKYFLYKQIPETQLLYVAATQLFWDTGKQITGVPSKPSVKK